MKTRRRRCMNCSRPVPARARADAKYCSAACRGSRWRKRTRLGNVLMRRCETCHKRLALDIRAHARFCSTRCRQKDYRRRRAVAGQPRKAHQRVIKERLAAENPEPPAVDIRGAQVRPITLAEARTIIEKFEPMPAVSRYCFGIFFGDRLGGAVVYGDEYGENLGVWNKFGFNGRIIALTRGCCCTGHTRTLPAS